VRPPDLTAAPSPPPAPGLPAAEARSDRADTLVASLAAHLGDLASELAVVALGGYGRRELTPRGDVELLVLHHGTLTARAVTEALSYPLWEQDIRAEASVRTVAECVADAHRSWAAAASCLDARLVVGASDLFAELVRQVRQPWHRDRERLLHRIRADVQGRHPRHASAAATTTPDLLAGRGGLQDVTALRWLAPRSDPRAEAARSALVATIAAIEDLLGASPHRVTARLQEQLAEPHSGALLASLYPHTRWVAFALDSALHRPPPDRQLGPSLAIRRGTLVGDRLPPPARAPSIGLRVANRVGLAAPAPELLAWASGDGPPLPFDETTSTEFWLFLRAADWRAWEFLDCTGLLLRYLPELADVRYRRGTPETEPLALDVHVFQSLRALHAWLDSGDPLAERLGRRVHRRDWLYLTVLLHELTPERARAAALRLGLPEDAAATVSFVVGNHRLLLDTATRRDLFDEDLLLELAARIGSPIRLSWLALVAVAHALAAGPGTWSPWQADLLRQLYGRLDSALRETGETGTRRNRQLEQQRARIVRALERHGLEPLTPLVARLPRRYVLARSPAFVARHLSLLAQRPLADGEVRIQAHRHRQPGLWDLQVVARDQPGLLATIAGVLSLRGATVLAADAATCADGLVLDVFTVAAAHGVPLQRDQWSAIASDVQTALAGRLPLADLLGARLLSDAEAEAIQVAVDNEASQFFSVVEVRAPDQVGLLYRIAAGLRELDLDIHHAKIATFADAALDVFYVWDLAGEKLDTARAAAVADDLAALLRGRKSPG
jgi:[protein-PII] uridylyltransferase